MTFRSCSKKNDTSLNPQTAHKPFSRPTNETNNFIPHKKIHHEQPEHIPMPWNKSISALSVMDEW
jgi:hypothetical protein